MDIRATELVLRKLIDAMERRCAGFPVRYELELLTIENAKEQLDKIQAELNTPANIQQQVQPDNGYCNPETGEPFQYTPLQVN
jgi:hypothetical protein